LTRLPSRRKAGTAKAAFIYPGTTLPAAAGGLSCRPGIPFWIKGQTMQVAIEDIKVKRRIRKDLGDIGALAESLKHYGQINPIAISSKNVLIAGERRLEAAKSLGWRTINAVIVDLPESVTRVEYEAEENFQRRDFTPEEAEEAAKRIYRIRNPGFFRRILNAIIRFFKRIFGIGN
jgi:ParB family chromosome partitioning protein